MDSGWFHTDIASICARNGGYSPNVSSGIFSLMGPIASVCGAGTGFRALVMIF